MDLTDSTLQSAAVVDEAPKVDPADNVIPRDQYLASRRVCREHSPDLFFACHQLDKPQRFAVFSLHAVLRQLTEIMGKPQIGSVGSCGTGGCGGGGCGGGESVDQRRNVCLSVIDHFYQGLDTGKPELDGFLAVRATYDLPREILERFVHGLSTELTTARYATWKRVRKTLDDSAGSVAMLLSRILVDASIEDSPALEQQIRAAGIAMRLMNVIATVAADWREGRMLLPLDDLVRAKIKLSELPTFVSNGTVDGDARWADLMGHLSQRTADLLRGAVKALPACGTSRERRFAAALLAFQMDRYTRLLEAGGDPFRDRIQSSTWRRMMLMRQAHKLAVNSVSIETLLKRWAN